MDQPNGALLTEPTTLVAFLVATLGCIFWLSRQTRLQRFFEYMPPVIWAYFLPMIATTIGLTPAESPAYSWMSRYLLPFSLFLLMMSIDLPAILRLGRMALIMMLAGTLGIVLGGPIAYTIFSGALPEDAWMGLAALSGSWIGGTANMVAIQQSVGAPDSALGPIIVVDTVVGYGWMGVLIFMTAIQKRFDHWTGADTGVLEATRETLESLDQSRRPTSTGDVALIVGLGFAATAVAIGIGQRLPDIGNPSVISKTTWAVLVVVTGGLALSFTRLRNLEQAGASRFGYFALYLLMTSIGARADLAAVLDAPVYLLTGFVWIAIHVGILILAAKLFKAPLFLVATGSMANVGGAASAPIVAAAYIPPMAPIGLLMAVGGYILGIYAALGCAWMLGQLSLIL